GQGLKKVAEVRKKLLDHYVKPLDEKLLIEEAIKGMIKGLNDVFTVYMTPEELALSESQFKGAVTGIGAQLKMTEGRISIVTPLEGSPALKAGLRPGDVIQSIDGKPAAGLDITTAVQRILGPRGEVVKLKVMRSDGVVEELGIARDEVRFRSVQG